MFIGDFMNVPLAKKLAPQSLSDVIGQEKLVGKNKILYNLVKNKKIFSMILYGEPGIGKTSIATALINDLDLPYRFLNATSSSKKDFESAIEEAKMRDGIILVIDEIHRMNKDKQDILLPHVESGLITLIGLTTSNPYHKINPAIRSRCQIFKLEPLTEEDILKGLKKATKSEYLKDIKIDTKSLKYITSLSGTDLRYAYNILEIAYYYNNDHKIDLEVLKNINNKPTLYSDSNEGGHYDVLSGLQKSIRGSDVNASLHYLSRLLVQEDFESIYRRLSVIAYEDIGLANPSIGPKLNAVINACEILGMPEARIPLSDIVIEMALSPKSNSGIMAIDRAINDIEKGNIGEMPSYLQSPYNGYLYPHNYPNSIVKQEYMPKNLIGHKYYVPNNNKNELQLKAIMENIEKIKND